MSAESAPRKVRLRWIREAYVSWCDIVGDPDAAEEEFDRWLSTHDAEVRAAAWEEGYADGLHNESNWTLYDATDPRITNPYRQVISQTKEEER